MSIRSDKMSWICMHQCFERHSSVQRTEASSSLTRCAVSFYDQCSAKSYIYKVHVFIYLFPWTIQEKKCCTHSVIFSVYGQLTFIVSVVFAKLCPIQNMYAMFPLLVTFISDTISFCSRLALL